METKGAALKASQHNYLSRTLKHHARGWLMGGTFLPRKETRERVREWALGEECTSSVLDRSTGATGCAAPRERGCEKRVRDTTSKDSMFALLIGTLALLVTCCW